MAAFSYQDLPLLADSVLTPDMVMKLPSSSPSSSTYPIPKPSFHGEQLQKPYYPFAGFHQDQLKPFECSVQESSCVDQGTAMAVAHSTPACSDNEPSSITGKQSTPSPAGKQSKRKLKGVGSSPNSANSKDVRGGGRSKKQRKCKEEDEEVRNKAPHEEPPKGYIHVRARRGQATDSHSLAERVRREKISERMKLLQALVPGCDKVTGKATMLDEIINYVQSLQSQVEFLSMKLASVSPIFYNFGVDLEALLIGQQGLNNMTPPMEECGPTSGFTGAPLLEGQAVFQQAQQREPCLQDNIGSLYWEVEDDPMNQSGFCNNNNTMYS